MALQVWLPLNGDLKNKGCADVTVTNTGATIDNNGKIGQCYYFDGTSTSSGKSVYITDFNLPTSVFSVCGWFKIAQSVGNGSAEYLVCLNNNNYSGDMQFAIFHRNGILTIIVNNTEYTIRSINYNTWYNLCLTFDGNNAYTYINGELVNTKSITSAGYIGHNLNIGGRSSATNGSTHSYYSKIYANDIRVYDHCLSVVEVKEISRGLVVHYKLSDWEVRTNKGSSITWNQLINAPNKNPVTTNGITYSVSNGSLNISTTEEGATALTTFTNIYNETNLGFSQIAGHKYYSPNTLPNGVWFVQNSYAGGVTLCNGTITTGYRSGSMIQHWSLKVAKDTIIPETISCPIAIYDLTMMFGEGNEPTLEEFNLLFPFLSYSYDSGTIIDSPILSISDCSGYGNHGYITSGTLEIEQNTGRYLNSLYISDNVVIQHNNVLLNNSDQEWTCCAWINPATVVNHSLLNNFNNGNRIKHGTYPLLYVNSGTNDYYNYGNKEIVANEWQYIVFVFKNGTISGQGTASDAIKRIYINGINQTDTNGPNKTCTPLGIPDIVTLFGGGYVGLVSDYREYATALSEEDVRQLYEVSAKIDDAGNLHSYEFEELEEGRELLVRNLTSPYDNRTTTYFNTSSDGVLFNSTSTSCGTDFIEINPTGHKYIYDYTISVSAGNQFYIGFERYDKDKTSRSNNACTYTYSTKPSSDIVKKRYTGTVNLSTDGVNPCKYIKLRVLNGWTGSDSSSTKLATIHSLSLREVPTSSTAKTKLYKTGVFESDLLLEGNVKTEIEKNIDINTNQFIEI